MMGHFNILPDDFYSCPYQQMIGNGNNNKNNKQNNKNSGYFNDKNSNYDDVDSSNSISSDSNSDSAEFNYEKIEDINEDKYAHSTVQRLSLQHCLHYFVHWLYLVEYFIENIKKQ